MTVKQLRMLRALRDQVMTPDKFNYNGLAYDTVIPGTILDSILELLSDHEATNKES